MEGRRAKLKHSFDNILRDLGIDPEKIKILEAEFSPADETVYVKLDGEVNGSGSALRKKLEEELKARVVLYGENFKVFSPEEYLREKLVNGIRIDVQLSGSEVIVRVPGDFAKERVKRKLLSMKEEIKEKLRGYKIKLKIDEEFFKSIEENAKKTQKKSFVKFENIKPAELKAESNDVIFGKKPKKTVHYPSNLPPLGNEVSIVGEIFKIEERTGKRRSILLYITDKIDSIVVRIPDKFVGNVSGKLSIGDVVVATGILSSDPSMAGDPVLFAKGLAVSEMERRIDKSKIKRVELHAHTKYSDLDSVLNLKDYVKRLKEWGHKAAAITDHGNVQGIIEFYHIAKSAGIKPLFGMEGYMVNDVEPIYRGNLDGDLLKTSYVVLDLETSGLDPARSEIVEIGAVKIENGKVVDEFQSLVKPKMGMSEISERITGITDEMLKDQPPIEEVLPKFLEFLGDSVIIAHNASFDYRFIRYWVKKITGEDFEKPFIDTLSLSRALLTMSSYSLDKVASKLKLEKFQHHRAMDDARITAKIFLRFMEMLRSIGVKRLSEIDKLRKDIDVKSIRPNHVTVLVKNKKGLKNLYKIVSESHIKYFHNVPRIPKSLLNSLREGLLIGSACMSGEVVEAVLDGASDSEIEEIMKFYDFIEIMPLGNFPEKDRERMKEVYKIIYKKAKELGIPVVMTGDVHFLDPEDYKFRMALLSPQKNERLDQPELYLRTTDEMLDEAMKIFDNEDIAKEVVIDNTIKIADSIEEIQPLEGKLHPPIIEGAEEEVRNISMKRAKEIYGEPLPDLIDKRLEKELDAIIGHGYAVLYLIAKKIVDKSKKDGYVVGSRGSVGSSLVAHLLGITEVNPLPPHYVCPKCKHVEFVEGYGSGYDLPEKKCPICGTDMNRNGQDIPFEVFMGFKGDKVPDIDLNFSGEYQERAHRYIEKLFGKDHVYRAGTISTVAERSARGYVRSFEEKTGIQLRRAEFERIAMGIAGVKRTTGQHPGGLMIIPKDHEVYDFTPVQFPANDKKSKVLTTHFAYEHIHDDIVKLDALGHDDPTFIKHLHEITGIDPMSIPMNDPETLEIFSSVKPLGIDPKDLGTDVGTLGIPEFGTKFVRGMLQETRPKSFAELVRISGLSHGTDVWLNNARDWINSGVATLSSVISCRDDIMNFLIQKGLEPSTAFKIMEKVRKGKGITEDDEKAMKSVGAPKWFIESCKKIKYLFPKAHAVAYVSMAFRIAYFKVHYPLAFYSAYFSIKGDEFNVDAILGGEENIKRRLSILYSMTDKDVQDKNEETVLEVALEMTLRGYGFLPPDLKKSDSKKFLIEGNKLRIPFNKLPGLGTNVAESIVKARSEKFFSSVEDLIRRTKVNKTHVEVMKRYKVLDGIPDTDQITLF